MWKRFSLISPVITPLSCVLMNHITVAAQKIMVRQSYR